MYTTWTTYLNLISLSFIAWGGWGGGIGFLHVCTCMSTSHHENVEGESTYLSIFKGSMPMHVFPTT